MLMGPNKIYNTSDFKRSVSVAQSVGVHGDGYEQHPRHPGGGRQAGPAAAAALGASDTRTQPRGDDAPVIT